jgi:hypothetical protein
MVYVAEGLASIGERAGKRRWMKKEVDLADISKDVGCPDISPSCLTCPLSRLPLGILSWGTSWG